MSLPSQCHKNDGTVPNFSDLHRKLPTESLCTILTHLQVLVLVQNPELEVLVRGTGHALQALRVEGEAHEGLGAGRGGLAEDGPLGHVPQQQGPVLVARQQERSRARIWLGGLKER